MSVPVDSSGSLNVEVKEGFLSRIQKRLLRLKLRRAELALADFRKDLREAQALRERDPSREGSDKAIIERLEKQIEQLQARLR